MKDRIGIGCLESKRKNLQVQFLGRGSQNLFVLFVNSTDYFVQFLSLGEEGAIFSYFLIVFMWVFNYTKLSS